MKRVAILVAVLLLVSACGREGGLVSAGTPTDFCAFARALDRDAAAAIAKLGRGVSIQETLRGFKTFGDQRRADYEQLERLAPEKLKDALRRQRDYRARFLSVSGREQIELVQRALANGTGIQHVERELCADSPEMPLRPAP